MSFQDSENETTCHQCRQKTTDTKTIRGFFCDVCLKKRGYQEGLVCNGASPDPESLAQTLEKSLGLNNDQANNADGLSEEFNSS